ncbi:MAG TPA: VOC family protein [Panacibacter sp.]|nr:VOC family protein [Panacibacter sp.]
MFKALRTVIYRVNHLQKAKEWYINITGIQPYFDEPFYVGFNINGFEPGLDPDSSNVQQGNNSIAYRAVDNIEQAVEKCVSDGAVIESPVQNAGGAIYVAVIKDPFGNSVGLITGAL